VDFVRHFAVRVFPHAHHHHRGDRFAGHDCDDPEEIVFVLPNKARVGTAQQGKSLLETAKLLMAISPNGI
jgi:hypothetical protein